MRLTTSSSRRSRRRCRSGSRPGTKAMICHAGFGGVDPRDRRVLLLPRDARRRLRRAGRAATARTRSRPTARTPRTRRSRRPSSTTRSAITRYELSRTRRGRAGPRRPRPAPRLPLRPTTIDVHDPGRPRPRGAVGAVRRASPASARATSSTRTARRAGSARRRRSSSTPATSSATRPAAAAATARPRSATRSACSATSSRAKVSAERAARASTGVAVDRATGDRRRRRPRRARAGRAEMSYRLGVDIGGTFTDAILVDEATGAVRIAKVSSTPSDPSVGFLEATTRILAEAGVRADALRYVVHGTTVATNAIIEGKVARTGVRDDRGLPRPARDRPPDPPLPLRPPVREAAPARPARPLLRRPASGSTPRGDGARAARRGGRPAWSRSGCATRASRRSRSASSTPTSTPSTSAASARSCARCCPDVARLALVRGRARVPRVLPRQHDRHQRRHPAGRRAVPGEHRGAAARRQASTPSCS